MSILSWRTTTSGTSISWSRTRVKCERYPCVHVTRSPWPLTRQSTVSTWFVLETIGTGTLFTRKLSTAESTKSFTTCHKVGMQWRFLCRTVTIVFEILTTLRVLCYFKRIFIFTARHHASAVYAMPLCLSVRLSQVGVLSKLPHITIKWTTPHDSTGTLVDRRQRLY